ncbi:13197_t:CDS:1 [Acaulospora morrowiae]|uniref:13197_t:CDS:1 n=1 Tax=Acaulospora morrowiae TaxID=94023 RepID=A0A9N8V8C2_9GLOM|nr:13197_t:CDS:1 [Acaulospora morrowiae]
MDEQIRSTNASSNTSELEQSSHVTKNIPKIKLPFPPVINPQDLISLRESPDGTRKLPSRAPNAFIIFRKQFVKAARDEGYFLPMTVISSMASEAWEAETEEVKSEYRRIAKEAHIKRKAMYPKSSTRRRRKDRWNIVSFQPTDSSDSISAITSRIPNDQPLSQYSNNGNGENPSNSPSLNFENTSVSSPEFSSEDGDYSPIIQSLNTFFPGGLDYLITDNSTYNTLGTAPSPYDYCFEVGSNTLEDQTFGFYPSPNNYTSDDDSIYGRSPYLDAEQLYNDYINHSIITNANDDNQSIMTPESIREFNTIIESNIQQNDCYDDWQGFYQLQNSDVGTNDPTNKSREEKSANEDTMWISEQLDMLIEGNRGDNMISTDGWFNISTSLANGCFGEALGIVV